MPNSEYWKNRMQEIERMNHEKGIEYTKFIDRQFRKAEANMQRKVEYWFGRIAENNGISMSAAKELLRRDELEDFHMTLEEYIEKGEALQFDNRWMQQLENASAKVHIRRLEALQMQIQQECEVLYGNMSDGLDKTLAAVYEEGYYHTAYELMRGHGVGWSFNRLDTRRIQKALDTAWLYDGKNFKTRCKVNKNILANELQNTISQHIIRGESPQKTIDALAKKLRTSRHNAGNLIMTETCAISSRCQKDCYQELGVDKCEFVATLDNDTSEVCRRMDGVIIDMADYEIGTNIPPLHCFCRSCTVPYYEDDFGSIGERAAKGDDGKTYYVPANMTYEEWKKSFVDGEGIEKLEEIKADAKESQKNIDFMGKPKKFKVPNATIKAYEVSGKKNMFTQTYTQDAKNTINYLSEMKEKGIVTGISEIVISKDLPGVAAYDHVNNILYVNEKLTNAKYIQKELANEYFIAENKLDVLKHEMFHKQHWDFIMTKGEDNDTIKKIIEADLRKYVKEQIKSEHLYILRNVSQNANNAFVYSGSLNELIAEVLLQDDKGKIKDEVLLKLVRRCVE